MKNPCSLLSSDVSKLGITRGFLTFSMGKWLKTHANFKFPFHFFFTKRSDFAQIWSGASFYGTKGDLGTDFWNFNFLTRSGGPKVKNFKDLKNWVKFDLWTSRTGKKIEISKICSYIPFGSIRWSSWPNLGLIWTLGEEKNEMAT